MKLIVAFVLSITFTFGRASVVKIHQPPLVEAETCYKHYGCFSTASPWRSIRRPLAGLPNPPYEVGTRFLLFTRQNVNEDFELVPDNEVILGYSPFDKTKRTIFLIHGFIDSHKANWMVNAKNELLNKEDINVISVDWSPGANGNYLRATNNARMLGSQLTRMLNFLAAKANLNFGDIRIVAHSIGAHAAGYAGQALQGRIGHITALDPVDQYFSGTDEIVRLDTSDAKNVHVIHTNGDLLFGMGLRNPLGHVDIFPNGGNSQPGCDDLLRKLIKSIGDLITWDPEGALSHWACSHVRAADYYVESISSKCPFVARKCDNYGDFEDGKCTSGCKTPGSCTVLGYGSDKFTSARGNYYLDTDEKSSFCMQAVQFDTSVNNNQGKTTGELKLQFRHSSSYEVSDKFTIVDGTVKSGQILSQWVNLPSKLMTSSTDKPDLILRYERSSVFQPRQLKLDLITLFVLNENLEVDKIRYSSIVLDNNKDTIVYAS